jgi:uncharacterized protein (DUF427 family)
MAPRIEIEPAERVRVLAGGEVVADSARALRLVEGDYAPVYYLPREDVRGLEPARDDRRTTCPWKGEATYFDLVVDGSRFERAAWTYAEPKAGVAEIRDHVAFYRDRVDEIRSG